MKTILSLDYEVFFGTRTGSVERTLIEPTNALVKMADRHGVKLAFFVDAGFLVRLHEQSKKYPELATSLDLVRRQLEALHRGGHDLQLHIHSHWEDCHWNGEHWVMDVRRYRLHDFSAEAAREIVGRYKAALMLYSGNDNVFAYRAGGWVLQPFDKISAALKANGIYIDSTVFAEGTSDSETHYFDFRGAPKKSSWRFEHDPLVENEEGYFFEVPISAVELSPQFFWKFAWIKKFGSQAHRAFGDGAAIPLGKNDLMKKLLRKSHGVVSMDGYRSSYLARSYREYARSDKEYFVVIGHPKALSQYSLDRLEDFCADVGGDSFITYQAFSR